jgi:hypothetical protein
VNAKSAIDTALLAPITAVLFGACWMIVETVFSATRPETTGRWGETADQLYASSEFAFGLLSLASDMETLLAVFVIVGTVVGLGSMSSGRGF